MHIEFVVEDSSGKIFLEQVLPKIISDEQVTWRVHGYRGIGRIPKGLATVADPAKRIILDQLPRLLGGYSRTPYVDAVVVVVDTDTRDCRVFLKELSELARRVAPNLKVLFRLAIEEMEAWYLGDVAALRAVYNVDSAALRAYVQDSICGTWERLADIISPGGSAKILAQGWPAPGVLKAEWAKRIPPNMNIEKNMSPSFAKLRDGVRALIPA